MAKLDGFRGYRLSAVAMLCAAVFAGCLDIAVLAQSPQAWPERIEQLRSQIKSGEEQHAGAAQMGGLWLQLANRYQDQLQYDQAEDAFAHALPLLKDTDEPAKLADALDGMGWVYLSTGRLDEAETFTRKALTMYEGLNNPLLVAKMHETIGLEYLFQKQYRQAESESADGLVRLRALPNADAGEMVAAYVTHSSALCNLKRYSEALEDTDQARQIVEQKLPNDTVDLIAVTLFRGFAELKSGSLEQGDKSLREAVQMTHSLKSLPMPMMVTMRMQAMHWYDVFLKDTHRKLEAKAVEMEMARLSADQPAACSSCTVSVASLTPGLLPH